MASLEAFAACGQSIWLDFIRRSFMTSGDLQRLIDLGLRGITSNPAIFEKAIARSDDYHADLASASDAAAPEAIYEEIAIRDIRTAADHLRPVFDRTDGGDGFVSLEVSPLLAHDARRTVSEAQRMAAAVDRPNLMIKVPATTEGAVAMRTLIEDGIHVNATLIFSVAQYEAAAAAYLGGLEARRERGLPVDDVASVASLFVSRVDSAVDPLLAEAGAPELRGHIAVDNARRVYRRFSALTASDRWRTLRKAGARAQRPLWASTSVKNPDYADTLYVDALVAEDTVNTLPLSTLHAALDHGRAKPAIPRDDGEGESRLARLATLGIDLDVMLDGLQARGVELFADAYQALLQGIATRTAAAQEGSE